MRLDRNEGCSGMINLFPATRKAVVEVWSCCDSTAAKKLGGDETAMGMYRPQDRASAAKSPATAAKATDSWTSLHAGVVRACYRWHNLSGELG